MGQSASYPRVSAQEFFKIYDGFKSLAEVNIQVLDVRSPGEIASQSLNPINRNGIKIPQYHIVHSEWLTPENVSVLLKRLEANKTIYVLCRSGGRSGMVCGALAEQPG